MTIIAKTTLHQSQESRTPSRSLTLVLRTQAEVPPAAFQAVHDQLAGSEAEELGLDPETPTP